MADGTGGERLHGREGGDGPVRDRSGARFIIPRERQSLMHVLHNTDSSEGQATVHC